MIVFLINLDKDGDRLAAADQQLAKCGVSYCRFPAVYSKHLSLDAKRSAVSRFRWWCATGRKPTDGEIGCALSHFGIYRKMLKENISQACILEDDVILDFRFPMVLKEIDALPIPEEPRVILLSDHAWHPGQIGNNSAVGYSTPAGDDDFRLKHDWWDTCAECYVVNRAAASALLKANYPLITPCDMWMRWTKHKKITMYHAFPTVATQNKASFNSETIKGMQLVSNMSLSRYICHKCLRLVGVVVDHILFWCVKR